METQPTGPDTATIAANALSTLEAQQNGHSESAPTETSTTSTPSPTNGAAPTSSSSGAPAIELSAEAQWLKDQGHSVTKADGKANWLPLPTVEKMLGRYRDHHKTKWDEERATWQTERATLAQVAQQAQAVRRLMEGDPKAFLQRLAQADQRYQAFLQQQEARAELPSEADDPEPEPDLPVGNGYVTYSRDGLRKLREWERRQMERAFDQRLAPLMQRAKAEERQAHEARVEGMLRQRTASVLERASKWPKWKEYEGEILKVLQQDSAQAEQTGTEPQLTVHDAYMQVAMPYLQGEHNSVREQVIKELNGAPRSTAVASTGAEPVRKPGGLSTEDIARRAYARLERSGS